jgi:hypothetical protein
MNETDPKLLVTGSELILDEQGGWPNFHDAEINDFKIWHGDIRPEDSVYIGPRITIQLELCALKNPFCVLFKFEDCENIKMSGFNNQNPIMDLVFDFEERGNLKDGTPMTPYITVHFLPVWEFELSFKCFRVSVERIADHEAAAYHV